MNTEFERLITSDGLEMVGLFFSPDEKVSDTTVIHVHGLAGNFYENRLVSHLAEKITSLGFNFMAFNNRGHDYISDSTHIGHDGGEIDYLLIGGAYEIFEDCLLDIDAFISFAKSKGSSRFILDGHSHGALKVGHYLYRRNDPQIAGGIFISPSDDFGANRDKMENFDKALVYAKNLVENNKGSEWMLPEHHSYPMCAATYLDTFRSDSPLKIFNLSESDRTEFPELGAIKVPILGLIGTVEEYIVGEPEEFLSKMGEKLVNAVSFDSRAIDGAPHNYMGHENELADTIGDWLNSKF